MHAVTVGDSPTSFLVTQRNYNDTNIAATLSLSYRIDSTNNNNNNFASDDIDFRLLLEV